MARYRKSSYTMSTATLTAGLLRSGFTIRDNSGDAPERVWLDTQLDPQGFPARPVTSIS